jgi:hypothetical protein
MTPIYGKNRRTSGDRQKREIEVEIMVAGRNMGKVYSLDLSPGGLKVAGIGLRLALSEQINFSLLSQVDKYGGKGIVSRKDGPQGIQRIGGRLGNAFFIKVDEQKFRDFVEVKFNIKSVNKGDRLQH